MNFIEAAMSCLPFYLAFMIANRNDLACQSDLEMGRRKKNSPKPQCNFESNDVWIKLNAIYFYILSSIQIITKQFTGRVNHQKLEGKGRF